MSGVLAGAAVVDVTPPAGLAMSGFAARTLPATGAHDPLTVRAVCVDDTAVVTVDVVGLDEGACARIRARCPLPDDRVVVHATHTHGGPVSMHRRLGSELDGEWLASVVDAGAQAVARALERRAPARLLAGLGADPGVARNRRRDGGPVDDALPTAWLVSPDGAVVAVLVSYACHPVVLGADNTLWTADYPGVVRAELERRHPGAVALFLTGCAGDANTGHAAAASVSTATSPTRTFAEAERVGRRVAEAALAARPRAAPGRVSAGRGDVDLRLLVPPAQAAAEDRARWEAELALPGTDAARRALLGSWLDWAERQGELDAGWSGSVGVLRWGGVTLVALPGEPFAEIAHRVRRGVDAACPSEVTFVVGYSEGCPGYLPTREEYADGGYEVLEAHRYYGMAGPFAPGSAELVADRAIEVAQRLAETG